MNSVSNLSGEKTNKKNDKPSEKVAIIFLRSTNELKHDNFDGNFTDSDDCSGSECDECMNNSDKNTTLKKILKVPKKTPLSKKFKIVKGKPVTDLQSLINSLEHPKATKFQKDFVEVLRELNGMIGMTKFKEQLINQLLFFIQDYKEPGMFLHTALFGSPGTGKCLGYNTPVIMFDGNIKMVQDVKVGDKLMGDDGLERNVLSTCTGEEKMFEIQQKNADNYIVNESHILSLILTKQNKIIKDKKYKNGEIVDISVKDYNALSASVKSCLKGYKCGINFKEQTVEVDPYLIGIWLGDGTSAYSSITNQDSSILHYLANVLPQYKCYLSRRSYKDYTYNICGTGSINTQGENFIMRTLKKLDLINNKHIPDIYKYNSRNNQLRLLAGLLDTDGYYCKKGHSYDIIQKNYRLAKDIEFIARCLGFTSNIVECKKGCMYKEEYKEGTYYRQNIYGNGIEDIPCIVPRKRPTKRNQIKNNLVTGINLTQIKENYYKQGENYKYYYGFEIDGNHRFLLGDHTVTHNTSACKILAKVYSKLGILQTDKVVVADRASLVAKYLGQTAIKTKEVLKSAKGGVLLLDEVYSLGSRDGGDSFSKECIDTINQYLSENAEDLICVIAGYKDQVQECFFNHNPGLERRFPWKFTIDDYNETELCAIFRTQISNGWEIELENSYIIDKIKNNKELFKGNGGDTKNLIDKCKMAHARRTFTECDKNSNKKRKLDSYNKIINKLDFDAGFKFFVESKGIKKETSYINNMYI